MQLIEQHTDRIEVAPAVDAASSFLGDPAPNLFGAHVVRCTEKVALARQLGVSLVFGDLGDAEVEHLQVLIGRLAFDQHQVGGLQVAMDDRLGLARLLVDMPVGFLKHRTELVQELGDPGQGQGLTLAAV